MLKLVLSILVLCIANAECLRLLHYHMPSNIDFRDEARLSCEFDTEGEELYSVRWFVNGTEFYRYGPSFQPQKVFHYVDGISVQLEKSSRNTVTLGPLFFTTSGDFRCEASTAAPHFRTLAISKRVTIIAYPKEGPTIEGMHPSHLLGDDLFLNCTSAPSYPAATLSWTIDDEPVSRESVVSYFLPDEQEMRIQKTKIGIRLRTEEISFKPKEEVIISCVAVVPGIIYKTAVSLRLAAPFP